MGYATYQTGYRGEVSRREYRTLLACDIVPAVTVDGVPTSWKRIVTVGNVTETVKEIVGLSYSDAHATGSVTVATGTSITLERDATYSSGDNPVETYAKEIERVQDGDSMVWTVRIIERTTTIVTT